MPDEIMMGTNSYADLIFRFVINLIAIFVLARGIYYPLHRRKEYLFTFFLFNVLIFLICLLLSSARLQVGFAFGLFAVFSMIRYRTVTIPVKEMGYFFVCVALGLINALVSGDRYFLMPIASDLIILVLVVVLDKYVSMKGEQVMELTYERMDLVQPTNRAALLEDLQLRTGLPIRRVEIITLDFLRDVALLNVYY